MHPTICTIGPFTIYSYGLMLAIAFITVSTLVSQAAKIKGMNSDAMFNFLFISFIAGIIGARLFYVIEHPAAYLANPLEIIMLSSGGLSWFGGLILGLACGITYLKKKKIPIFKAFDLVAPFLALGQAIGRIGCLLNGCCYGKVSSFGFYSQEQGAILIPTQLYSSLLLLAIFIVLRILQERPHKQGEIFLLYLFLYSIKRFFIEFWRADNEIIFFNLTLFQLLSAALFFISLIWLIRIKSKN